MCRNSAVERFEAKFTPEPNTGCWLWTGATGGNGEYGGFWDGKRIVPAHRWSFEYTAGRKVRANLDVHHKCGQTLCVNPRHLKPVAPVTNQYYKRRPYCLRHDRRKRWTGRQYRCQGCQNEYGRNWRLRHRRRAA